MKDNMLMVWEKEKENTLILMEMYIKEIMLIIKNMESEKWFIRIRVNIMVTYNIHKKVNGKMDKDTVKDCIHMQIKMFIQDNGIKVKNMEMELMSSMTLLWGTREIGKIIK